MFQYVLGSVAKIVTRYLPKAVQVWHLRGQDDDESISRVKENVSMLVCLMIPHRTNAASSCSRSF